MSGKGGQFMTSAEIELIPSWGLPTEPEESLLRAFLACMVLACMVLACRNLRSNDASRRQYCSPSKYKTAHFYAVKNFLRGMSRRNKPQQHNNKLKAEIAAGWWCYQDDDWGYRCHFHCEVAVQSRILTQLQLHKLLIIPTTPRKQHLNRLTNLHNLHKSRQT